MSLRKLYCTVLLLLSLMGSSLARVAKTTGLASWYGKQHQGRKMANGQRFDRARLTAAHRSYRLGTLLLVCFLRTGDCVQVEITDRGPAMHSRVIDLSEAAANQIGLKRYGIGRVSVEKLNETETQAD